MKKPLLAIIVLTTLFVACNKNDYQTKPQIKISSVNGDVFPVGSNYVANLNFTDKEGDLGNGVFTYIPKRLNKKPLPSNIPPYGPIELPVPEFPDNAKGDFELRLRYVDLHKSDIENDTLIMRFVVKDRAGNVSDTVDSSPIVILKN